MYLNPKNRSVSFQKRLKMFYFHHFKVFTRCRFQNVPIRVPFSKSAVFKFCWQKMCRFRVNRRPIRRLFHRFQNVPASCERSLSYKIRVKPSFNIQRRDLLAVVFVVLIPFVQINTLLNNVLVQLLLYGGGDKDLSSEVNKHFLELTLNFIHQTGRFD